MRVKNLVSHKLICQQFKFDTEYSRSSCVILSFDSYTWEGAKNVFLGKNLTKLIVNKAFYWQKNHKNGCNAKIFSVLMLHCTELPVFC